MRRLHVQWVAAMSALLLCPCVAACGRAANGAGSRPSKSSTASVLEATNPASAIPPSPSITGDYDGDDNDGNGPLDDGDDDDSKGPKDRDNDSDNSSSTTYYDSDDRAVRGFGHAADAADRRSIARLVRHYFAAAEAENGATACSVIVRSIFKAIPTDFGRPPAQPYSRGDTCAAVMSGLFAHYHRQLAAHAATLRVSEVRVDRREGLVLLAFRALPGRQTRVLHEGSAWRMAQLLDTELP